MTNDEKKVMDIFESRQGEDIHLWEIMEATGFSEEKIKGICRSLVDQGIIKPVKNFRLN